MDLIIEINKRLVPNDTLKAYLTSRPNWNSFEAGQFASSPYIVLVYKREGGAWDIVNADGAYTGYVPDDVIQSMREFVNPDVEISYLRAEIAAKDAEIARLRNSVSGVLITMSTTAAYQDDTEVESLLVHFAESIREALKPTTPVTAVTPDDDTQKLPELVECEHCGGEGRSNDYYPSIDARMLWQCPVCNGSGMVENLPFADASDLEQAPTPKFKVGDRVRYQYISDNENEQTKTDLGNVVEIVEGKLVLSIFVNWDDGYTMFYQEDELTHAD